MGRSTGLGLFCARTETEGKGAGYNLLCSPEVPGTGGLRIAQQYPSFNSGQRRWQLLHTRFMMLCEISEAIDMVLSDPVKVNKDSSVCLLHTTKAHLPSFSLCVVCEPFPISLSLTKKSSQWSCHMCSRVVVVCQISPSEVSISQFLLLSGCHPSFRRDSRQVHCTYDNL